MMYIGILASHLKLFFREHCRINANVSKRQNRVDQCSVGEDDLSSQRSVLQRPAKRKDISWLFLVLTNDLNNHDR